MSARDWIPGTKLLTFGTIYQIVEDMSEIIAHRWQFQLTENEIDLIALVVGLAIGYLVPEMKDKLIIPPGPGDQHA